MVSILRKGLFAAGEWINGWNVFERLDQLHEMERWDRGRIEEFKLDNLKRLAHSAYANVPLYRQLWDKAGVRPEDIKDLFDLSGFPCVTKQMLREAGDLALDERYPKKRLRKVRTTGSTGEPLTIYKDKTYQSWFLAGVFLGWKWAGWKPGDRIVVQEVHKPTIKQRIEDWVFNYKRIPLYTYNDVHYKEFIEKAIPFRPFMMRLTPTTQYCLAEYVLKEGIDNIGLKAMYSRAASMYPPHRVIIEKAFGSPIYESYGSAEMITAHRCEKGSYHILPSVHVEVDRETRQSGNSGPNRLFLTNLTNYAMPLIRYDIADMAGMGEDPCACGRTWEYLTAIYGRESDTIRTPSGNCLFWGNLCILFMPIEGVDRFQVVQEDVSKISLCLVTNRSYLTDVHEPMIMSYLSEVGGPGLDIEIKYVDSIPIPPSGKYRYIISRVADSRGE
jgi:phenylacetate-CoA ligase